MARNMQPIAKRCKALNLSPAAMGYAKKDTNRNPKGQSLAPLGDGLHVSSHLSKPPSD